MLYEQRWFVLLHENKSCCLDPPKQDRTPHCNGKNKNKETVSVWNLQLFSTLQENSKMISFEINNDKCSERHAIVVVSILFKEIQWGYSNVVESMCAEGQT